MNHKTIKASIAAAGAITLAATGSTFALWGDWDTLTGSQAGAEELSLVLNEPNTQDFDNIKLAPGVGNDFEFVVVNRTGTTIPAANLRMVMENLDSNEDGCTSTNSEAAVDPDCGIVGGEGDFDEESRFNVNASAPTTDIANACNSSAHPRGSRQTPTPLRTFATSYGDRAAAYGSATGALPLLPTGVTLAPGQGICVAMGLSMPTTASDASQGDSASFDLTFLLNQVAPVAP